MKNLQQGIKQMSDQVTERWNTLTKKQKAGIGLGIFGIIIAVMMLSILLKPKYKKLFLNNVDPVVIAKVAETLEEKNIAYQIVDNSENIEVKEKQYQQALMYTASSGATETGLTLDELLTNDMSITNTQYDTKKKEYTKQTLQDTLEMIEGVKAARIELVIPEQKNTYLQSQAESSASVFLTLTKELSTQQCEGIATYISTAVQNLDTKNIVIIDDTGRTLYSGDEESVTMIGKQQEIKVTAENQLKQKVVELLDNIYDEVRISSNLILDFDQYQENNTQYSVQGEDDVRGIIATEKESSGSSNNQGAGGEPGTGTNGGNTPTYQTNGNSQQASKEEQKEIIYSPDKKETVLIKNLGDIDLKGSSLSVHLFNNRIYKEEQVTPTLLDMTWDEFKDKNSEQKVISVDEAIIESIQKATGIQNISVNAYEKPIFLDQEEYVVNYKDYIPYLLLVLLLMGIVILILRFRKHDEVVEVEPELEVEDMLKTAKDQVALSEIEVKENLETKRQIDKFVDEKPEAVANLLRNWLTDDEWE